MPKLTSPPRGRETPLSGTFKMNYLAHLYLSDGTPESLVGSLLGDFVKGDDHNGYSAGIQRAILIHRQVDAFTDAHPTVARSKRRLDPPYRHIRGILVDLFYDHFLAANWRDYAAMSLTDFTRQVYGTLWEYEHVLPERLKRMLPYMAGEDWLLSYREVENIGMALKGLSRRLSRSIHLDRSLGDLRRCYAGLETDFRAFFPDLIAYAGGL